MLFEALAGASIDELRRDYMVTMLNFYKQNLQGINLQASAKKYLMECGLSEEECEALRTILTSAN